MQHTSFFRARIATAMLWHYGWTVVQALC